MNIVEKRLEELQPYENNPRKNDAAVEYVANSIKEFGFKVPIIVDKNGVIVAGHTRYLAAMELGMETVPTIIADDLTPEQVRAYRLADNKVSEFSNWDWDMLQDELNELNTNMLDFSMEDFGFFEQNYNIDDFLETQKKNLKTAWRQKKQAKAKYNVLIVANGLRHESVSCWYTVETMDC